MTTHSPFDFDNTYARDLPGFYVPWQGDPAPAPDVLRVNDALAAELGLHPGALKTRAAARWLTGSEMPAGAAPLAMAYAGHQFGGFSPQLGDGRALLIGEVVDRLGRRRDLQLKGSGRTPFSRGGDGKAVLGPVLREYLIGEAMHALGIPTTRALAAALTGETVLRDEPEKGAVLARVAASHLRVGTFQFFAAREETEKLRALADYAIARHFPDISGQDDRYLNLFRRVRDAQAVLVAHWVSVGFVHGVMNTDNMAISGETIDYGPCAFIDEYDPAAVFSSIDHDGRYAFGRQPTIAQWNLSRFAETLISLVNPDDEKDAIRQLTNEISVFPAHYQTAWLERMRAKLGLSRTEDDDLQLVNNLHAAMEGQSVDFTKLFRALADVCLGDQAPARALFKTPEAAFDAWLDHFTQRVEREDRGPVDIAMEMKRVNPLYIPRNHLVEDALQAAASGDMAPFDALNAVLSSPFAPQKGADRYAEPAPRDFGPYRTFCGT